VFIDAHCHINALPTIIRSNLYASLPSFGICIDSSINYATTVESLQISLQQENVYSAIGFHPLCAQEYNNDTLELYKNAVSHSDKIAAIGEIGLDEKVPIPLSQQEAVLRKFLEFAKDNSLPVIIHYRHAGDVITPILDDFFSSYEKIVFHCFSYDAKFLHAVIAKGAYISFSLNVLRKQERILQSLIACPLERLLLETDSPYMKINQQSSSPLDIKTLYEFAGSLRRIDPKELAQHIFSNAKNVFSL